jgi:hypothetical protein
MTLHQKGSSHMGKFLQLLSKSSDAEDTSRGHPSFRPSGNREQQLRQFLVESDRRFREVMNNDLNQVAAHARNGGGSASLIQNTRARAQEQRKLRIALIEQAAAAYGQDAVTEAVAELWGVSVFICGGTVFRYK